MLSHSTGLQFEKTCKQPLGQGVSDRPVVPLQPGWSADLQQVRKVMKLPFCMRRSLGSLHTSYQAYANTYQTQNPAALREECIICI